jgi:ABC-2 type transport system permease protein
MHAFLALVRKDLILYFTNRRALVMSIAAPILIAAFFGYLFDTGAKKPSRVPVALVLKDGSETAKKIAAGLAADSALEVRALPEAEALDLVRRGKLGSAVVVPEGFGDQAARALFRPVPKPALAIYYDPSQAIALAMIKGLLAKYVMQAVGSTAMSPAMLIDARADVERSRALAADDRATLLALFDSVEKLQTRSTDRAASRAGTFEMPFTTSEQELTASDRKYNSFAHAFAGMGVQFILFMGIELGMSVLLARRLGLWKRLRAAPLSRGLLLGSRIASGAVTAVILLAVIFAAAILVFGVRIEGSVAGFIGVSIAFALLTATFGMMIAALGKTPEATRGLAIFATLILVMLGGAWVPTFVFPEWLQTFSLAVPTRWAIDGLDAMTWRGLGIEAASGPIAVMLAFSAVFGLIAVKRFEWEE